MPEIRNILVANRGEIALRIVRTVHALGYGAVAVYSDADGDAPHVAAADEAVCIGPAPAVESYLNGAALIEAARVTGADAIHPGYGFLSENAGFAGDCAEAGLIWIGPPPDAIELMGSKRLAKRAMIAAGVPCIPGYDGADQSDARLSEEAERIGFPLMVKASAGGGGRGMRLVTDLAGLGANLHDARSEALAAFGSDELILERAITGARHVEIQIFADMQGNVVHLGERDCSLQRRHQKVVEEAPSPFVSPALRAEMGAAAIEAARACGYVGAGTVEFLVDAAGDFRFLEMNTRLQVEHPVTEMVTGLDLVEWQLRIAAGEPLPLTQEQITLDGWAMEARLYAEDPMRGFAPQTGRVLDWAPPQGAGVRVDGGIRTGQRIGPHYDPMLAKIVAHGPTRDVAQRRLLRAVQGTVLLGVVHNKGFLADILDHPVFAEGQVTTDFLQSGDVHRAADDAAADANAALAAVVMAMDKGLRIVPKRYLFWSNSGAMQCRSRLETGDRVRDLSFRVTNRDGRLWCRATDGAGELEFEVAPVGSGRCDVTVAAQKHTVKYAVAGEEIWLDGPYGMVRARDVTFPANGDDESDGTGRVTAPMDGAIVSVEVDPGDRVERGQVIAVLEAMKMQHRLRADIDGVVTQVSSAAGQQVRIRQTLAVIAPEDPSDESGR